MNIKLVLKVHEVQKRNAKLSKLVEYAKFNVSINAAIAVYEIT